nr:glycosyltransferase family 1 protein [Microbacterium endophyticum]
MGYTGRRGGTETYAREIITRLPQLLPNAEFVAVTGRDGTERVGAFFPGQVVTVPWVRASSSFWALGELFALDRVARSVTANLVWSPANFGPIRRGVPRVTTIHDLIYREIPGSTRERLSRAVTSWLMTRAARSSDQLITISQATSEAIRRYMEIDPDSVHVVLNGSTLPERAPDVHGAMRQLGIDTRRPIVLSTGNRMPHKNFDGLIRAVATLAPSERPLLVIPGSHGKDPLADLVRSLGLERDVILPGWITHDQLEALYSVCEIYICPSLAEGFGLPIVDALRRGCRVIANDIPVLREVGGDVSTYTDAREAVTFGAEIVRVLSTPDSESARSHRRSWGSRFTWELSAQQTAAVLHDVVNRKAAR